MFTVQTERLALRHFSVLDLEPMLCIFGDAEVMRFGDGVQTSAWVQQWLLRCVEQYRRQDFGVYAVVERESGEVIGYCGLFFFPNIHGRAEVEIGYRLARVKWGCGYATEAATAVRDYAFQTLGVKRLIALIDPQNRTSICVAEKLGMRYESEVMLEGYMHPDHVYVIEP